MIYKVEFEYQDNNIKFEAFEPEEESRKNTFGWTEEENLKYAYFIKENLHLFKT